MPEIIDYIIIALTSAITAIYLKDRWIKKRFYILDENLKNRTEFYRAVWQIITIKERTFTEEILFEKPEILQKAKACFDYLVVNYTYIPKRNIYLYINWYYVIKEREEANQCNPK